MNKQKGFSLLVLILIIVGVAVVSGGGVWLWQNYKPTPVIPTTPGTSSTPSITVTSPNGGRKLQMGKNYTIEWNSSGVNNVNIELVNKITSAYSLFIAKNIANTGSYSWKVPTGKIGLDYPSEQGYVVKITSTASPYYTDISDNYFSIVASIPNPLPITVTSPVAGTVYHTGDTVNIFWLNDVIEGDLSLNVVDVNGTVVTDQYGMGAGIISFNTPNTGNYSWKIPSNIKLGSNYRIEISTKTGVPPMRGWSGYFSIVAP